MLIAIVDCEAERRYPFATPGRHDRAIRIVDFLLEPYLITDFGREVQAWNNRFHRSSNSVQEPGQIHVSVVLILSVNVRRSPAPAAAPG